MPWKAGTRLRSAADSTEVIVVRASGEDVELRCGGHPMRDAGEPGTAVLPLDPEFAGGTQLGKRYAYDAAGLELLCTKAGEGALSVGTEVLAVKAARPLPSSD
jgi:hypothetical protein